MHGQIIDVTRYIFKTCLRPVDNKYTCTLILIVVCFFSVVMPSQITLNTVQSAVKLPFLEKAQFPRPVISMCFVF